MPPFDQRARHCLSMEVLPLASSGRVQHGGLTYLGINTVSIT